MCNNNVKAIMKKIYSFLFAATALFAASSCQKEVAPEVETPNYEKITFTASTEVETKTALHENGKSTVWVEEDQISVFDANKNGNNRCFEIDKVSEDGMTATFSYEGEFAMDNTQADPTVVALYPYQENAYCDFFYSNRNYITGIKFPAEQTAVAGSFDSKAAFALGLGTMSNKVLGFQNLYSLLKFTVTTANVKEVTVTFGGENAYVAGDAKIQMTLNTEKIGGSEPVFESPVLSIVEKGSNTVKLSCKEGFVVGTTYYIAVAPASYTSLSVSLDGTEVKTSSKANTLSANKIYNLGELKAPISSGWSLPGGHNNWTVGKNLLYEEGDYYVAKNVDIKANEFKFNHADFGWKGVGASSALALGEWHKLNGENNIKLAEVTGTCDIYMTKDGSKFQALPAGSPAPAAPVVEADYWGLIGSMTSWAEDLVLAEEGDYLVRKGVQLSATDEFKFRKNGEWAEQKIASATAKADIEYDLVDAGSNNMKVATAGTYDVYVKKDLTKVYFMTVGKTPADAGKATTYKLYIKNSKNWSNLYLYAWGGYATGGWPGTKLTKQEQAPDSKGQCYYIEIPLGTNIVNFIVNNGSGSQTADLKASNLTKLSTNDYFYELK